MAGVMLPALLLTGAGLLDVCASDCEVRADVAGGAGVCTETWYGSGLHTVYAAAGQPAPVGQSESALLRLNAGFIPPVASWWESDGPPMTWEYPLLCRFYDTFDLSTAEAQTARIRISHPDGVGSAFLLASDGAAWETYEMEREGPWSSWWEAPPPLGQIHPRAKIRYYFKATDGVGNVSCYPSGAPDECFEFSVLPVHGSTEDPGILLVDKHGAAVLGDDGTYGHTSEYYYREALDILGFEYDVFNVRVPGSLVYGQGPDTSGMKYYDTQVWFTSDLETNVASQTEIYSFIMWLSESGPDRARNLMISGNDFNASVASDTLSFLLTWMATEFLGDTVAGGYGDVIGLDHWDYPSWSDCSLVEEDPNDYDVIGPYTGIPGASSIAAYFVPEVFELPAAVAYYHPTLEYRTVNLGFGFELMRRDVFDPIPSPNSGLEHRVNFMNQIMVEFFGKEPDTTGTGVPDDVVGRSWLAPPSPNPFNPTTMIRFCLGVGGRTDVRIYDVSGRVVRTLVDAELPAGEHEVVWNGKSDAGSSAASGVYFIRLEICGDSGVFVGGRKAVLLQ
jgi:hypothetical protein